MRDITREVCTERKQSSHHLKPKRDGRGSILVCAYCGKTSAEIRSSPPTAEINLHFDSTGRPGPTKITNFNRKRG